MIQFLSEWLRMRAGAAPVTFMTVTGQRYYPMIMHAVDETGIVVSELKSPEIRKAYPWSAVIAVGPDRSE